MKMVYYVFNILKPNILSVGYYQNGEVAIKEDVIWDNNGYWKFRIEGPNGLYLKGMDKNIVIRGR